MKAVHILYISFVPVLLGCFEYIVNDVTPLGLLMLWFAYMLFMYTFIFKGFYFKEELKKKCINWIEYNVEEVE